MADAEVVAVAVGEQDRARRLADRHHVPCAHGSDPVLLADPAVDAAQIPQSHGGSDEPENLRPAHLESNIRLRAKFSGHHRELVEAKRTMPESKVKFTPLDMAPVLGRATS
jgi:hypothetical protein